MKKYYMYGQLLACLEFINGDQGYRGDFKKNDLVNWDRQWMSLLLRNHRRKLNQMSIQHVRFIEHEMFQLFQKLPVEPFPMLDTEQKQMDVREGYTDQLQRLYMECKGQAQTIGEVV